MRPAFAVVRGCCQTSAAQTGTRHQLPRQTQLLPASFYEHRFPLFCRTSLPPGRERRACCSYLNQGHRLSPLPQGKKTTPNYSLLTGQYSGKKVCPRLWVVLQPFDFLPLLLSSVSIAFPFCFFSFLPRLCLFLLQRFTGGKVCSRGGGVLSVVGGFIPIRGSSSGKKPVVEWTVAASRSESLITNGGSSTRITFMVPMRAKRKSAERAPTTSAATVSSIPTTCSATRLSSENGASG